MKSITQKQQVIDALRSQGGYATLKRLYEILDFSSWKTHTPEASVRKLVQESSEIFRIQPGLWALEESKLEILKKFNLSSNNKSAHEQFSHSYYQGLLIEIGQLQNKKTFIPGQDKHRMFLEKELGEISDYVKLPSFTYDSLLRKAKTVDVVWFNEREMPSHFYEIELTTDIKNSLTKFYELQDFYSKFYIVAAKHREPEFIDKLNASIFSSIKKRVEFLDYEQVASLHSSIKEHSKFLW